MENKNKWFAGYIVAGLIYTMAQNFNKTLPDSIIIIVIAVLCGSFYRRLKNKLKIQNEVTRIIVAFLIFEIISGFLIGAITSLI